MSKAEDQLLALVESYFNEHLRRVRGASHHTVRAYSQTLRLFFAFLAQTRQCQVAQLRLTDLRSRNVLAFLDYLETTRGNRAATRNARLAAIRGFVEHLLRHDPTRAGQYQRILNLPNKKQRQPIVEYLEPEEVRVLLQQPDGRTPLGRRDRALFFFLYNTGARVSEALAIRPVDLQLQRTWQVRINGKGNKQRLCPLWRDTATSLKQILDDIADGEALFKNARGQPLTRDGVAYLLRKYMRLAGKEVSSLRGRKVTPHVLRHSCAVALLQAGVDITMIRDYLGHASVTTTSRYLTTNLQLKRQVLDAFWERAGLSAPTDSTWDPKPELLAFLSSL